MAFGNRTLFVYNGLFSFSIIINTYLKQEMDYEKAMELDRVNIHSFKVKKKGILSTGHCTVETSLLSTRMVSKDKTLEFSKMTNIARLQEKQWITFLYIEDEKVPGVTTFSLNKKDEKLDEFEKFLKERVSVVDFETLPSTNTLRGAILAECPIGDKSHHQLGHDKDDSIAMAGQKVGHAFGELSGKVGTALSSNKDHPASKQDEQGKDQGKEKEEKVEDKPQHPIIKDLKDFGHKVETAVNSGYKEGEVDGKKKYEAEQAEKAEKQKAKKQKAEREKAEKEKEKAEKEKEKTETNPEHPKQESKPAATETNPEHPKQESKPAATETKAQEQKV